MKASRNIWVVLMMVAAVVMLLNGVPTTVIAGGEPGAGCDVEGFQYDPEPFIGDLTVEWIGGEVLVSGEVVRAGNNGCSIVLESEYISTANEDEFLNLKSNYLRGRCIKNVPPSSTNCDFGTDALFETVACGKLNWGEETHSFTAHFIIMHLEYR